MKIYKDNNLVTLLHVFTVCGRLRITTFVQ